MDVGARMLHHQTHTEHLQRGWTSVSRSSSSGATESIWLKSSDHHHLTTQEILSVAERPSFAALLLELNVFPKLY